MTLSPVEHLASRIAGLRKELADIDIRKAVIVQTIAELEVVRDAIVAGESKSTSTSTNGSTPPLNLKPKPASAVRRYLAAHPDGALLKDVVEALADNVSTTSSDPKRLLYNTILNMHARNEVARYTDEFDRECVRLITNTESEDAN